MASLLDIVGALGRGGSEAIDSRTARRELEAEQAEKDRRRRVEENRQRTLYEAIQAMDPTGEAVPLPEPARPGIGPDPDAAAIGIQPEPEAAPALGPAARVAAFDPEQDYATAYDVRRQQGRDTTEREARAERQRVADLKSLEDFEQDEAEQASNRVAFDTAKRLGAPEAQAEYNPQVDYSGVFTRYNTERSAERSEAAGERSAAAAARSAAAAARAAEVAANRLAAESRRDAQADAALRARGAIMRNQVGRLPPVDQVSVRQALDAVRVAQPDLDPDVVFGIVGQQFEQGLLPGQKVRVRSGPEATAPPGMVAVEDEGLVAEIQRMRGADPE